jgi:penicillin-binding protein 2
VTIPDENGTYIDVKNLRTVKKGMWMVANGNRGTARWWKIPGVKYAGKTGTSQVMSFSADEIYKRCDQRPIQQRHHGLFIGYAPADNPEIVVAVLTEHSCHGNVGSAPVARDVMRAYFEKYHPEWVTNKHHHEILSSKTLKDAESEED